METGHYEKSGPDATFMRMKEDAMLNGQLKPAYNIQHGVDSEYITWIDISPRPTDTRTLIPFLKDMEKHLGFKYSEIVADAGYESEENYFFIEGNVQKIWNGSQVSMGRNINKLHCKIQTGRTGSHLFSLKMASKTQWISMPFGHKAGLPPSKKYLLMRQPLFPYCTSAFSSAL